MIDDRELWACANLLLTQHGSDAHGVATRRAEELLAGDSLAGYHTFLRIADRIAQLGTLGSIARPH